MFIRKKIILGLLEKKGLKSGILEYFYDNLWVKKSIHSDQVLDNNFYGLVINVDINTIMNGPGYIVEGRVEVGVWGLLLICNRKKEKVIVLIFNCVSVVARGLLLIWREGKKGIMPTIL